MEQNAIIRFRQYIIDGEYTLLFSPDTVVSREKQSIFEIVT